MVHVKSRADTRVLREMPLADEAATARLGAALAGIARPGDIFALQGDLGAGKTTLARAFIQALCGTGEDVPSPTFTLVQTYQSPVGEIAHFDLYRIGDSRDVGELGWDDAVETGIVLVEWPDRLGPDLPQTALTVVLGPADGGTGGRMARLLGAPSWRNRLDHVPSREQERLHRR